MNRQRKIVITTTYNEIGIIIDTEVKELNLSAQPEREKSNWIYGEDEHGTDGYTCEKCGFFVPWDYASRHINYIEDYHYCPNCGKDMRGSSV